MSLALPGIFCLELIFPGIIFQALPGISNWNLLSRINLFWNYFPGSIIASNFSIWKQYLTVACNYCLQLFLAIISCNYCLQLLLAIIACNYFLKLFLAIISCNYCLQLLLAIIACNYCLQILLAIIAKIVESVKIKNWPSNCF